MLTYLDSCHQCFQQQAYCICDRAAQCTPSLRPICILQHPQEYAHPLNTIPLLHAALPNIHCSKGLSWPNLKKATQPFADHPQKWLILYPFSLPRPLTPQEQQQQCLLLSPKGVALSLSQHDTKHSGLLVLDGSWQQVKTLWWRNPWLQKISRIVLLNLPPSMYGKTRAVPRKESQSSLEAVAAALEHIYQENKTAQDLRKLMRTWLQRRRDFMAQSL